MPDADGDSADDVVERAFRAEAGRALATIARLTGDLDRAEDAVQDAYEVALRRWPVAGVPANPGAWVTTTARNRALDVVRREATRPEREQRAARDAAAALDASAAAATLVHPVADDQLQLLFTCCHPALAPGARVALALRFVCGLPVRAVARLLLQGEEAVAKRIQRAKDKIRTAAIPLRVPPPHLLAERVPSVLEVVYLTFTEGYAASEGERAVRDELCDEAVRLARLTAELLPAEPGAAALLALVLLQDSRRAARFGDDGGILLLEEQDRRRWDHELIHEGLAALDRATAPDPRPMSTRSAAYVLQAAIAAEHARAPTWAATDWPAIVRLYDQLHELAPSPVVALNRAVAVSFADGPGAALAALDDLCAEPLLARSHLLIAARADVRRRLGRHDEARELYRLAVQRAPTASDRALLERRAAGSR